MSNCQELLTDDDIADFIRYAVKHLRESTELLIDLEGRPRPSNFISSANYAINNITNELEEYAERLRMNGNVYKTRNDFLRMLKIEQEYKEDEQYFKRLSCQRAGMEKEPPTEETSFDNDS